MHAKEIEGVTFFHNSDYSGDVLTQVGDQRVKIPFMSLKGLVAEYVREQRIARLEGESDDKVLGLP